MDTAQRVNSTKINNTMKSSFPSFLLLLRLIVGSAIAVDATAAMNTTAPIHNNEEEAMSRIIIKFKAGKKASVLSKVGLGGDTTTASLFNNNNGSNNNNKSKSKSKSKKHYEFNNLNTLAVTVPTSTIEALKADPNIVRVEVDPIRYLIPTTLSSTIPGGNSNGKNKNKNKLRRVLQGGTQTVPYGIDMVEARDVWDANRDGSIDIVDTVSGTPPTGANRTVCIIDSGYHATHEDLRGITVSGYDGVASLPWNEDQNSHGTHVAGTYICVLLFFIVTSLFSE